MGVVHKRYVDDKITDAIFSRRDYRDDITLSDVHTGMQELRDTIRDEIEACRWVCPIHEKLSTNNDCEECDDALNMNVIINNVLAISTLQKRHEDSTT